MIWCEDWRLLPFQALGVGAGAGFRDEAGTGFSSGAEEEDQALSV